ncbi:iron-sulfur cluster assembly protein [Nocardioides glacieisoli]|uniref:Iron-sulfur cluster assembly protein n=1 Tax=Nocardioides glacieisoli TaxID=1168730 RepID=A0A4Q2RLN0_9ACTN|nr:iron-sulfur cluster assembly protein [Nocardioides glacieisoli]RYB88465.1 iron-sulfur cluster assembly protein [Nocardioides glacieisoli]
MATLAVAPAQVVTPDAVRRALDVVFDPELDEPITDLGFVRSVDIGGRDLEVHLRLPTSFCSPNFAYLMASDSQDALRALPGVGRVVVELDDHHDSAIINHGLATDAGYRGTFRHEAEDSLDGLRRTFQVKAHTAAMERCLTALLRADATLEESALGRVVLGDLPAGPEKDSLLRRRTTLGLGCHPSAPVLVDEHGVGYEPDQVPLALRRARSTRISIDGNAHFCRGLLRTRYPGSEDDQTRRVDGEEPSDPTFIPLTALLSGPTKEPTP